MLVALKEMISNFMILKKKPTCQQFNSLNSTEVYESDYSVLYMTHSLQMHQQKQF